MCRRLIVLNRPLLSEHHQLQLRNQHDGSYGIGTLAQNLQESMNMTQIYTRKNLPWVHLSSALTPNRKTKAKTHNLVLHFETHSESYVVSESEDVSDSYTYPDFPSESVQFTQRLDSPPPDDFLSEALLVQLSPSTNLSHRSNPQPSTRKQTSPSKDVPTSPKRFKYPLSPHKETSSKFWDKQDHYSWIDQNTPHKPQKSFPTVTPAQLNKAKKVFLQIREELAIDLVRAIDGQVMGGKLSASTSATGGVKLEWSSRLRTAAGRAHWNRVKSRPLGETPEQHNLKIELSTKIITSEGFIPTPCLHNLTIEKLRNTLAHELCHCALWVIDKDPQSHHGKQFKQWSRPHLHDLPLPLGAPKSHTTSRISLSPQNTPTKSSTNIPIHAQIHSVVLTLDVRENST